MSDINPPQICSITGRPHRFKRVRTAFCSDTAGGEGVVFEDRSAPATCMDCFVVEGRGTINLDFEAAMTINRGWDDRSGRRK